MSCRCTTTSSSADCFLGLPDGPPDLVISNRSFPQYAYGLLLAAIQAHNLGLRRITAIELGVAGGNGLVTLERLTHDIKSLTNVSVDVAGFDLAVGMPEPSDYRDMPYVWQKGFFEMDVAILRSRLTTADLILGDIGETLFAFLAQPRPPIGFISFDLDYYSSTVAALTALQRSPADLLLPRAICYFDDTVGPHEELHCEYTGELLAISEFNHANTDRKLARINGLSYKLHPLQEAWMAGMFVLHHFAHPDYTRYIYHERTRQFPLESP